VEAFAVLEQKYEQLSQEANFLSLLEEGSFLHLPDNDTDPQVAETP
jgi:hypothetical protein